MDWGTIFAIAAVNIGLIAWLRSDMKDFSGRIESWKEEINKEMKDFHAKLERQDAEFKAHIMYEHKK